MAAVFERLVYAWSERGLEGSSRYQVTAATPRIRQAVSARAPLLDVATRVAYWAPATNESAARVFGWQWTKLGLFVFAKYRVPVGHWAATGGFVCHIYHTVEPAGISQVCSLAAPELLEAADLAASRGDLLEPLPATLPTIAASGAGERAAELMAAALLSLDPAPRLGLAVTSEEMFDGLLLCSTHLPLPRFTSRSVSTSEAPDRAGGFGLVGIGADADAALRHPQLLMLTPASVDLVACAIVRTALAEPVRARAAMNVAATDDGIDSTVFSAILRILTGEPALLTVAEARAVLAHADAAGLALETAAVRAAVIELALANWNVLGSHLAAAFVGHPDEARGAGEIADSILRGNLPHELWRDLGTTNPRLRHLVAQHLAGTADGGERVLTVAPSECLASVLQVLATLRTSTPRTAQLRDRLLRTLSSRLPREEVLAALSDDDSLLLATMWWEREQWNEFGGLLRRLAPRHGKELCALVADDEGRRRLARWAQVATGPTLRDLQLLLVTMASAVPVSGPFMWVMTSLAAVVPPEQFLGVLRARVNGRLLSGLRPDAASLLADRAATATSEALLRRVRGGARAQLTIDEQELMRWFAASSTACAQLHHATTLRYRLTTRVSAAVAASQFSDVLRQVGGAAGRSSGAATLIVFDAVVRGCADPTELASMVELAAEEVGVEAGTYWTVAFDVFDAMVRSSVTADASAERRHLFTAAVKEGARRGHFGSMRSASSMIGMGLPREIRDRLDRW